MRRLIILICVLFFVGDTFAENVVLINGTIIDGTGKARAAGNVRIRDGKLADIGVFKPMPGETTLDVKGMIVAPGFIDLQNVSPATLEKDLGAAAIAQGVTTAVLGSDGNGPYSIEDFMLPFDDKPAALNIAMLVGHGTVRRQIMGADYKRAATSDEVERMSQLVADAMKQGAFGLGSDLQQEPASFSVTDELMVLAKTIARFGGTLAMRPRDDALKEALDVARSSKAPVQISRATLGAAALAEIDKARAQGVDVAAYAYAVTESGPDLRRLVQNSSVAMTLSQYIRDDKAITLERAVQKMSSLPASRLGLRERGVLKRGAPADIAVFNPLALAAGMKYVFVNGTLVIKEGEPTSARPGQALR